MGSSLPLNNRLQRGANLFSYHRRSRRRTSVLFIYHSFSNSPPPKLLANIVAQGSNRLDHLLVPCHNEFRPIPGGPDLLLDHNAMSDFIQLEDDRKTKHAKDKKKDVEGASQDSSNSSDDSDGSGNKIAIDTITQWEAATKLNWDTYVNDMERAIVSAPRNSSTLDRALFAHTDFLNDVDALFNSTFSDKTTLGTPGEEYRDDLIVYIEKCVEVAVDTFNLNSNPSMLSLVHRQLPSKLFLLWLRPGQPAFPLLTKSFFIVVHKIFSKYPNAIKEVLLPFFPSPQSPRFPFSLPLSHRSPVGSRTWPISTSSA
jgi:hypothetical protein